MENNKITAVKKADMENMLAVFRTMEIVAQSESVTDFDPREHYNQQDADYDLLMQFFNKDDNKFNFKLFLKNSLTRIGSGFQNVLIGYEALFEKYCDPDLDILKSFDEQVVVNGKLIGTYDSFEAYRKDIFVLANKYSGKVLLVVDNRNCLVTGAQLMENDSKFLKKN